MNRFQIVVYYSNALAPNSALLQAQGQQQIRKLYAITPVSALPVQGGGGVDDGLFEKVGFKSDEFDTICCAISGY